MATAEELTEASTIPFADGTLKTFPAGAPICTWLLVPDPPMIDANSGYVNITFFTMTLERAKLVDGGDDTTIAGRAATLGAGDTNGVVYIDAGGGQLLRLEMSISPAVREQHETTVPEFIRPVAEAVAGHL
jgi:hypothetical protein